MVYTEQKLKASHFAEKGTYHLTYNEWRGKASLYALGVEKYSIHHINVHIIKTDEIGGNLMLESSISDIEMLSNNKI